VASEDMPMIVFGGDYGLQTFLKMFYNTDEVTGGYIDTVGSTSVGLPNTAHISQEGVIAGGFITFNWLDLADRVILLRREGRHLVLVDHYTSADPVMIVWEDDIDRLETNFSIIRTDQYEAQHQRLIGLGLLKEN
jgi:hypothetical protein